MEITNEFKAKVLAEANRRYKFNKNGSIEDRPQYVIDNFLSSIDTSMPMIDHFRNAMRDAILYKWNSATVVAIMAGIEDAYPKNKEEE